MLRSKTDELVTLFKDAAGGQNYFETWNAFISSLAGYIATASHNDCAWLRERSDAAMASLPKRTIDSIPKLHEAVIEAFEENPRQDLLGDAYMRIGIGSKDNGQFFTPYHVSSLCARMAVSEESAREQIVRHGYVTISEPAVGGGANVIAAAHALLDMGINYQKQALFEVQELSELTALTCYVQMSLLGMAGVVYVGNTLAMVRRFELWTPMLALDEIWLYRMVGRRLFGCNRG